jgi:hypothetical protein
MSVFLSAITSKLAGPIASVVAALLAVTLAVVWLSDASTIKTLHGEIDAPVTGYAARLVAFQTDSAVCRGKVADQNEALDRLAQVQSDKADSAVKAIALADAQLSKVGNRVTQILAAKPGPSQCDSADALILGSLK